MVALLVFRPIPQTEACVEIYTCEAQWAARSIGVVYRDHTFSSRRK